MDGSNESTMEKSGLKKLLASISTLRCSLSSTCGASSHNISDVAESPVFVPSRRHQHHDDGDQVHTFQTNRHPDPLSVPPSPPPPLPLQPPPLSVECRACRPTRPRRRSPVPDADGRRLKNVTAATRKSRSGKLLSNGYGFTSCSSGDSDGASFSSDEDGTRGKRMKEEETETLFSSRSFSSDSSEFYNKNKKKNKKNGKKKKDQDVAITSHHRRRTRWTGNQELLEEKEKTAAGKEGLAVVTQSSDPYGDFRSSVLEMVVENQIVGARELEQLLRSYLALNSRSHHPIILKVFSDVWETLFTN